MILPGGVSYAEVGGSSAVSRVRAIEVGGAPGQTDAWLLLWEDGVSVHPLLKNTLQPLSVDLSAIRNHGTSNVLQEHLLDPALCS